VSLLRDEGAAQGPQHVAVRSCGTDQVHWRGQHRDRMHGLQQAEAAAHACRGGHGASPPWVDARAGGLVSASEER